MENAIKRYDGYNLQGREIRVYYDNPHRSRSRSESKELNFITISCLLINKRHSNIQALNRNFISRAKILMALAPKPWTFRDISTSFNYLEKILPFHVFSASLEYLFNTLSL